MIGTENFNPQLNPQKLVYGCIHPHSRQEFALRCPSFVAVFLRVQIQCCLDFSVPQNAPDGLRFHLRLVRKPIAQTVPTGCLLFGSEEALDDLRQHRLDGERVVGGVRHDCERVCGPQ